MSAIIHTDEDLVFLINEQLEEKDRITDRTFQSWKANSRQANELDETGKEFLRLIKKALTEQRKNLFDEFKKAKSGEWQKWAWILERKFDEWNVTNKNAHEVEAKGIKFSWQDETT